MVIITDNETRKIAREHLRDYCVDNMSEHRHCWSGYVMDNILCKDCLIRPTLQKNWAFADDLVCDLNNLSDSELEECISIIDWDYEIKNSKSADDEVEHPTHYEGKRECIELMRLILGDDVVKGFCKGNSFKYRFRAGRKDGHSTDNDIQKAEWYEDYLEKMIREDGEI